MAGSLARPAQTWKKQMIWTTRRMISQTAPARGTMMVMARTALKMPTRAWQMKIFKDWRTWKAVYLDYVFASRAMMTPTTLSR